MENKILYDDFCKEEKKLPIFFQPWYLDAACRDGIWDVALVRRDQKVVAVLPYFLKRKGPFQYITMPQLVKWMGPYFVEKYHNRRWEHKLLPELISQIPKVHYYYQQFVPGMTNWLPFYWKGYRQSTAYTYILEPLENLETVFAQFSPDYRNNKIKKAKQQIEIVHDLSATAFYEVCKKSYDRQELNFPVSFDHFRKFDQVMESKKSRCMLFAVDKKGDIHSVLYLIWDGQSSYNLIAGDDPALRQSGAGILLVWEAIQYTKKVLELNRFNFLGSMIQPIERVRRQFGAVQQPYFKVWRYNSSLFKLLEWIMKRK